MNTIYKWSIAALMCVASASGTQAAGILRGAITETSTKQALIGAELTVFRQGEQTPLISTFTDEWGAFEFELEEGWYRVACSYLDFKPVVQDSVQVLESNTLELAISLGEREPQELEGVVVVGSAKKNSVEALYVQQQNA